MCVDTLTLSATMSRIASLSRVYRTRAGRPGCLSNCARKCELSWSMSTVLCKPCRPHALKSLGRQNKLRPATPGPPPEKRLVLNPTSSGMRPSLHVTCNCPDFTQAKNACMTVRMHTSQPGQHTEPAALRDAKLTSARSLTGSRVCKVILWRFGAEVLPEFLRPAVCVGVWV